MSDATKGQGEPVAWLDPAAGLSWLVDRMTVAPGTKLYTRADPGEVERLRAGVAKFRGYCVDLDSEKRELEHKMDAYKGAAEQAVTLRAKLAERDELLRTVLEAFEGAEGHPWMPGHVAVKIKPMVAAALSASAEPQQNQTKE